MKEYLRNLNYLYFGHPMSEYGTDREKKLIKIINEEFPDYTLENPNQKVHQFGCLVSKTLTKNPMNYFFNMVLPNMDCGVFLPFEDGMFGAGVYGEAEVLENNNKPIFEISQSGNIFPLILDSHRKLSIEDTISRLVLSDEKFLSDKTL